jgi:hypothetical protein
MTESVTDETTEMLSAPTPNVASISSIYLPAPIVETKKFDGTIANAYGKELDTVLAFEGDYQHILFFSAIPAKEMLDEKEILAVVNNKRKATARATCMQKALDDAGIQKPTLKDDSELQVKTIAKGLAASGKYTEESALALARQMLGL